jgi:hypothetical protein
VELKKKNGAVAAAAYRRTGCVTDWPTATSNSIHFHVRLSLSFHNFPNGFIIIRLGQNKKKQNNKKEKKIEQMVVTTGDGRRPSMRSTCLVPSIPMRDTISLEKLKIKNKLLKIVPFIYYNTHDARFNQNLQMESIFLVFNFLNVSRRRDRCCVLCRQEKWAAEVCVCGRGVTI